ncbi:Reverse transcriptase from transposon X-element protein [Ceratobasidium sp. AG-Ba]|nr:Reverse transcriptase from transposon X-element protein [Ceratobasidium sp. AG-Ba]QRV95976.1 Reverse transcriptase from transposon X-element protein [Ceratobasidium sp. AG-Ba]QRV95999.1 Reverse transcriptase from transposon X-element protein [Ceratobasidium sp. AG-Ba]QRV96961.1 Reverse transcriptase from transposon X-element protein [Ceratobasidium sp. AG-Ba]QRV97091.1 Reverse transcriptase from transposon X-element protein [Ceratobasidium sp. AG-Ba]
MASKANKPTLDTRKASLTAPGLKSSIPKTPVDSTCNVPTPDATPAYSAPNNLEAAITMLSFQGLMEKRDAITMMLVQNLLSAIARQPGITNLVQNLIYAVALLLPKATDNSNTVAGQLLAMRKTIDDFDKKVDKLLGLAENPVGLGEDAQDKLNKVLSTVEEVSRRAEATEKAAEESKTTLITFVDQQGIDKGRSWANVVGDQMSKPTTTNPTAGKAQKGKKKESGLTLPPDAIERCHHQASTILLRPINPLEAKFDKMDARALTSAANRALEKAWESIKNSDFAKDRDLKFLPKIVFKTAKRTASNSLLFELGDHTQAALISLSPFAIAFENAFAGVVCQGQLAEVFMDGAPTSFDPTIEDNVRAIEEENQLDTGSILGCSWLKPAHLRTEGQATAVLRVSFRSRDTADNLIATRATLFGEKVTFRRPIDEPIRCMKCQKYGHKAGSCKARQDTCSRCAGDHRQSACPNPGKTVCANCKSDEHPSWYRKCEAYAKAVQGLDERRPENGRVFFDPTRIHKPEATGKLTDFIKTGSRKTPEPGRVALENNEEAAPTAQAVAPESALKWSVIPPRYEGSVWGGTPASSQDDGEDSWSESDHGRTDISVSDIPTSPIAALATRPSSRSPPGTRMIGGLAAPKNFPLSYLPAAPSRPRSRSVDSNYSVSSTSSNATELVIWQLNTNKSHLAQTLFTQDPDVLTATLLAIQEPSLDKRNLSRPPARWTSIYPSIHYTSGAPRSRSYIAINPKISSNAWEQLECACADVTAIRLKLEKSSIMLINVYNPCDSNASLPFVDTLIKSRLAGEQLVVLGDFNRHHPTWDEDRNAHLFTRSNLELAQELLDLAADNDLDMILPKDIPTLEANNSGNYTRPDNVFASYALADNLVLCNAEPENRVDCTDHFPIKTVFDIAPVSAPVPEKWNFKQMNKETFKKELKNILSELELELEITIDTQENLDNYVTILNEAITRAVKKSVPRLRLSDRAKRWWTKELTAFRRKVRKLANRSFRARASTSHPVHEEYRKTRNAYTQAIRDAKQTHWEEFLEGLGEETIWTAAKFVGGEQTDGGRARIPNLKYTNPSGHPTVARDNASKSKVLLDAFFPAPPAPSDDPDPPFLAPVDDLPELTVEDVRNAILDLKPHKAPGPDGLPACVYIEGVDLLAPYLHRAFLVSLREGLYPSTWRHSRTVVLRKPGKPDYSMAKAYRPIALLNVVGKILSSCVARRLNFLAEKHEWFPEHHFGGRQGRTTTDALHLLVKRIKDAWAKGEVASALFLDVKGAFPHANPYQLARNMRALGVPRHYINWMLTKLEGRTTCLSFDDFESNPMPILNGIDQGCPLSVVFYLLYNAPLVRVARRSANELCIAYIDDITFLVTGKSAEENNVQLRRIMTRKGGALDWSRSHNSSFELDKTGLIHFSRKPNLVRPSLTIREQVINPARFHTLLGVILDQTLRFKEQCHKALAKGLLWTSQLGRIARMSVGASPRIVRKLYLSIAVPRFTYAADVWFMPISPPKDDKTRATGSIGFADRLSVIQSSAARIILGALKSTPVVHLDAFSSLLPIRCLLNETCQRSAIRLATVPNKHPLYKDVKRTLKVNRKYHASPLHNILRYIEKAPFELEQWSFKECPTPPLTIPRNLFPSADSALWEARVEHARTKVYADGAKNKTGVGAGAVLQIYDRMRAWTGARLGKRDDATILEAELAGIWLALHVLQRLRYIEEAVIYSDSQLAIACIEGHSSGAPKSLLAPIRKLFAKVRSRPDCTRLNLKWCPAHKEILGNTLADKEAKLAAKGEQYPHDLVPLGLVNYRRCITKHLAKECTKQDNRFYANRAWRSTAAGLKLLGKYPLVEPSEFLRNTAGLNRAQATLIFRIVTGHIQLQSHLHTLRLVDSPACQACGETRETVSHFVLFCPKYTAIRQHVLTTRGRDFLSLSFLFSSRSGINALLEYVRRTNRLANYLR